MSALLDFRSDTVTTPTAAMRKAMAAADVGDDVFGEDPTVQALEQAVADKLGMDAGLFVPSGTMGNQIATWVHTGRHGQVICEAHSHIALYEGGAASLLSGANIRTVEAKNGAFTPAQMTDWIYPDDPHFAQTRMVATENTYNYGGGRIWPLKAHDEIVEAAHAVGARLHVDGARIFNAAVATKKKPARLVRGADSVMTCLSKGLGAPVGSVLCGSGLFIHEARRVRKALGGGMRQAGVIAAAGLVAMDTGIDRLADDHKLAKHLGKCLAKLPDVRVDQKAIETNMVLMDVSATGMSGPEFCDVAKDIGVGCLPRDAGPMVRFVTHRNVGKKEADKAVERLGRLLESE